MATIVATHLTTSGAGAGASQATASVTCAANKLQILAVSNTVGAGTAATPTVTGASRTWTQIATRPDSSNSRRMTFFRALSGSAATGALTIDFGGVSQTGAEWSLSEFENIDTGGTNGADAIVQSAANDAVSATNTGLTVTLAAFSHADNATHGVIRNNQTAPSSGSGFTQLGLANPSGNVRIQSQWKNSNDTSVDWTWGSVSNSSVAIAIEIKAAQAAAANTNTLFLLSS